MESVVTLYKGCKLRPEKLFIVDSLSTYLATLTKETFTKFQYVRQGLKIEIKLPLAQTYLDYTASDDFNYCSIRNGSEKICYYFITDKKQISPNTLLFKLEMDTINTFTFNTSFTVSNRTKINRQHKDRFVEMKAEAITTTFTISGSAKTIPVSPVIARYGWGDLNPAYSGMEVESFDVVTNNTNVGVVSCQIIDDDFLSVIFQSLNAEDFSYYVTITIVSKAKYVRKIDKLPEGLTPILYGQDLGQLINDEDEEGQAWYLIYKGSSNIECLLAPEVPVTVNVADVDGVYHPNDFTVGVYYYFMCDAQDQNKPSEVFANVYDDNYNKWKIQWINRTNERWRDCVVIKNVAGTLYIGKIALVSRKDEIGKWSAWMVDNGSTYEPTNATTTITIQSTKSLTAHKLATWNTSDTTIYGATAENFSLTPTPHTLKTFSTLDRTDSTLIKIIKLPYKIFNYLDIGATWDYNSATGFLQYRNVDIQLMSSNIVSNSIERNPLTDLVIDLSSITGTEAKSDEYESKLLHSDFYQPKVIYDNFSKIFALERIDLESYSMTADTPFEFNFYTSNTITSKFLFVFTQYITGDYKAEDFDNILAVDRNNEMTIYNSDYLNYIKTGFNYDIKKKNRQEQVGWAVTALALVGSVASFALGPSGIGALAGITLATTSATKLIQTVNQTAEAEATQAQKIKQLQMQSAAVLNTDAVDLLDVYCPKAKLMIYKVSEVMKKALFDLFFYTGYVDNTHGIPDVTTRTRFNFVSCDLVVTEDHNIPSDIMNDITLKYNAGVTFLHKFNGIWDWTQQYENWEKFLFE